MTVKPIGKYLWDARTAAEHILRYVEGRTFEQYLNLDMFKPAVERQFEIIGEALNNLRRVDPELAKSIPDIAKIIAFRNILAHDYAAIDDWFVWRTANERLSELRDLLHQLEARLTQD